MAELLGVVASGMGVVSLAFQLADSIKKLKDFHALMTDAPRDISLTLDEVEILTLVLQEIDRDLQKQLLLSPAIKAAAIKSLRLCNVALEALSCLVGELEKGIIMGRKKGAFKAVLQKDKVEMFRKQLESTKLTMLVANQCYHGAVQRLNWESHEHDMLEIRMAIAQITQSTISGEVSHTVPSTENKESDEIDDERLISSVACLPRNRRQLRSRNPTFKHVLRSGFLDVAFATHGHATTTSISLHLPRWLCARRFDIDFRRSYHGWDHSIRMYKIISSDALVITYCKNGNLAGLQDLFSNGLASPFEVDLWDATPLHYAALYAQAETCRFLLTCGADVNARTNGHHYIRGSGRLWHHGYEPALRGECFYDISYLPFSTPLHQLACGGASARAFHERSMNDPSGTSYPSFANDIHATAEVLYTEGGSDPFQEASGKNTVLDVWRGPLETFRWLRKEEHIQFESLSRGELIELIFSHMLSFQEGAIEIIREIIPKTKFASLFPGEEHIFLWINLLRMAIQYRELAPHASSLRQEWTNLLDELVCVGFQRRFLDEIPYDNPEMVLLYIISISIGSSTSFPNWFSRPRTVKRVVVEWLMNVVNAGVNLLSYGQKEISRLTSVGSSQMQNTLWTFEHDLQKRQSPTHDYCLIHLVQLRIGARPEEWDLEFEDLYVSASLARYFWILVEGTNRQKVTLAQTYPLCPIDDEVFDELEYEEDMAIPGSWYD